MSAPTVMGVRAMPRNQLATWPARPNGKALTLRELQVLFLLSLGYTYGAAGRVLYVDEQTVKTHAARLRRKLGALSQAHAATLALRYQLLHFDDNDRLVATMAPDAMPAVPQ